MKVLSLHSRFSSFFSACFREANIGHGIRIHLICSKPSSNAPFGNEIIERSGARLIGFREDLTVSQILDEVESFGPELILTSGWMCRDYIQVCRWFKKRGGKVVAYSDTAFRGGVRQGMRCLLSRWLLHSAIDVIWVAGEPQREYAERLGFEGDSIWEGALSCDWKRFAKDSEMIFKDQGWEIGDQWEESWDDSSGIRHRDVGDRRIEGVNVRNRSFLFVGRYAPEKGIDTLIEAYMRYREQVGAPWSLVCAGAGPLRELLVEAGAEDHGFVQPDELPELMHRASAFVLPSRFEPWGVVLHEAGASRLPLICSDACGAAVHLLRDQFNGYLFPTGDADALAGRMVEMTEASDGQRTRFGDASFELSKQYTPERWAATLSAGMERLQGG